MQISVRDSVDDRIENQVDDGVREPADDLIENPYQGNLEAQEEHDKEVEPKNNKKGGKPRKKEKIRRGVECDAEGVKFLTTLTLNLFTLQ